MKIIWPSLPTCWLQFFISREICNCVIFVMIFEEKMTRSTILLTSLSFANKFSSKIQGGRDVFPEKYPAHWIVYFKEFNFSVESYFSRYLLKMDWVSSHKNLPKNVGHEAFSSNISGFYGPLWVDSHSIGIRPFRLSFWFIQTRLTQMFPLSFLMWTWLWLTRGNGRPSGDLREGKTASPTRHILMFEVRTSHYLLHLIFSKLRFLLFCYAYHSSATSTDLAQKLICSGVYPISKENTLQNMSDFEVFKSSMLTWSKWVDSQSENLQTKIFFRSFEPPHK